MYINMRNMLKFSSIEHEKIVAGHAGLSREVKNVTVLEVTEMNDLGKDIFGVKAGDLVISAFYNIKDDPQKQCRTIEEMNEAKAAGLVLFYIGEIIKTIDPSVIALCNKLHFPLICLDSKYSKSINYAEVMNEVVETLLNNKEKILINSILKMRKTNQKLVDALKSMTEWLDISILIMTPDFKILEENGYLSESMHQCLADYYSSKEVDMLYHGIAAIFNDEFGFCYYHRIGIEDQEIYVAFCNHNATKISKVEQYSTIHLIDLSVFLWIQDLAGKNEYQLIYAMIRGDKQTLKQIVHQGNFKPELIQGVMVTSSIMDSGNHISFARTVKELAAMEGITVLKGEYQQYCVFLFTAELPINMSHMISVVVEKHLHSNLLWYIPITAGTEELITALQAAIQYYPLARKIFAGRELIGKGELHQIKECSVLQNMQLQESFFSPYQSIVALIKDYDRKNNSNLWETLTAFLLLNAMNIKKTAQRLHTHHNTILYRIRKIETLCQISFGSPADVITVYRAVLLSKMQ